MIGNFYKTKMSSLTKKRKRIGELILSYPKEKCKEIMHGLFTPSNLMINCIILNTRETNNAKFKRHCRAMVDIYKTSILALLEIRMSNHNWIVEDLDFSKKSNTSLLEALDGL